MATQGAKAKGGRSWGRKDRKGEGKALRARAKRVLQKDAPKAAPKKG